MQVDHSAEEHGLALSKVLLIFDSIERKLLNVKVAVGEAVRVKFDSLVHGNRGLLALREVAAVLRSESNEAPEALRERNYTAVDLTSLKFCPITSVDERSF
jgi:hypothetical protein